eukprot:9083296-Heterocapsa_arctica.AAC.1
MRSRSPAAMCPRCMQPGSPLSTRNGMYWRCKNQDWMRPHRPESKASEACPRSQRSRPRSSRNPGPCTAGRSLRMVNAWSPTSSGEEPSLRMGAYP